MFGLMRPKKSYSDKTNGDYRFLTNCFSSALVDYFTCLSVIFSLALTLSPIGV